MPVTAAPRLKLSHILSILKQKPDSSFSNDNLLFTADGRTALHRAIHLLNQKSPHKKWLFPAYCCPSLLQIAIDSNIPYELYPIDHHLQPSLPYLSELLSKRDDIGGLILIHYFGFRANIETLRPLIHQKNIAIIEDCAHLPFPTNILSHEDKNEAQIYSLRKLYPIPHGGAVILKNSDKFSDDFAEMSDLSLYKQLFKFLIYNLESAAHFHLRNWLLSFQQIASYLESRDAKENRYDLRMHSKVGSYFKRKIPSEGYIQQHQKKNYLFLSERFQNQNKFSLLKNSFDEKDCPFTFPILVKNGNRNKIYNRCLRQGIPIRIYWRFLPKEILSNPLFRQSWDLSEQILCLPIHYELTLSQLEKISKGVLAND